MLDIAGWLYLCWVSHGQYRQSTAGLWTASPPIRTPKLWLPCSAVTAGLSDMIATIYKTFGLTQSQVRYQIASSQCLSMRLRHRS